MKDCYVERTFSLDHLAVIARANGIIEELMQRGYQLTLRQLYYQMVARAWIANEDREYKRLGAILNDARLAGLVDWNAIVDRTRTARRVATWDSPANIIDACAQQYRVDLWRGQPVYVEVWVEKDALVDVVSRPADRLCAYYLSCRGYLSVSAVYKAAKRFCAAADAGRVCTVLHLGDHDPSGIQMTEDIQRRLDIFGDRDGYSVHVDRIALNMVQVQAYNPPPNPAKLSDSRAADYVARFGSDSWELDALDPGVIDTLVASSLQALIEDPVLFDRNKARQRRERAVLNALSERWEEMTRELFDEQDTDEE